MLGAEDFVCYSSPYDSSSHCSFKSFPMQDRSAISLQDRGDARSVFPALGIIATYASFHCAGKWSSLRHRWKILCMSSPT